MCVKVVPVLARMLKLGSFGGVKILKDLKGTSLVSTEEV